jgi:2-iminobutanoate/2-iminopropanoate deaminase
MHKRYNPPAVAGPHGAYSHGIEVPPHARWLSLAGQVPTRPDGSVPEDPHEQVECVFRNMFAVLDEAGMGPEHLVRMTSFITGMQYFDAYMESKAKMMGEHRPTSTLVVVSALAYPEWFIEIESLAAKAD